MKKRERGGLGGQMGGQFGVEKFGRNRPSRRLEEVRIRVRPITRVFWFRGVTNKGERRWVKWCIRFLE